MGNIVGEGFPKKIIEQVNRRQLIYGSLNRTNEELTYLNSRTGWVKLVSSVNVTKAGVRGVPVTGVELARDFVLFGGTSNQDDKRNVVLRKGIWDGNTSQVEGANVPNPQDYWSYGMGGTAFGINPMPGLTSAEIKTETRGSLKTATIKVKANNRNQFDIIDSLYMRLGYSMLLEWGNSSYFLNDGTYKADYESLAEDFLNGSLNYGNYLTKINEKRLASCGNYDALVGKVVNFNWSYLQDGTYDITIILRSMGDVIESLKTNSLLPLGGNTPPTPVTGSEVTPQPNETTGEETPPEPTPEDIIRDFANTHEIGKFFNSKMQAMSNASSNLSGLSVLAGGDGKINFIKQTYPDGGNTQYYVRLERFLYFLKTTLIPYVNSPSVKLLDIDTNVETNLIYTLARQISTDPRIVIFNTVVDTATGPVYFASGAEPFFTEEIKGNRYGKIMNAYFNMTYILTQLESLKDKDGKVNLFDLLKSLCDGWNSATGNFNKLEPTVDSESNKIVFIDEVTCPDKDDILSKQGKSTELAYFNITGLYGNTDGTTTSGFVRDLSFSTTISPNLATMITVGATSNGYVPGQDATALSAMNNGFVDRFKKTLNLPATANNNTKGTSSLEDSYQESIAAFDTFVAELGSLNEATVPTWNEEAINAFTNAAVSFYEYDQAKQTEEKKETNPNASSPNSGFLPFDLSLTIDGLSGMKVYQKYTIDASYLPSNYPTSLEFIIKGITNTIQDNQWITVLESMAIPKNANGSKKGKGAVYAASTPSGDVRDSSRGVIPAGAVKGSTWTSLSEIQRKNAIYLYNTLLSYGFTDIEARAIMGIVSKESGFVPRNETSYRNTKASRIRKIFPSKFPSSYTDAQIDILKKNDAAFWNRVYGGRYGNNSTGDGSKYLGRGFNGLTFKGNYETYNKLYKQKGSKAGVIDIVNDPDVVNKAEGGIYKIASHIAALYFQRNKNNFFPNAKNPTLDQAIFNFMRANAGWGSSTNGFTFQEGLAKAKKFVASLPKEIA